MRNVAIFGFKDSTVGQFLSYQDRKFISHIKCLINFEDILDKNLNKDKKNPTSKLREIIKNNKIFNIKIFSKQKVNYCLSKYNINEAYILEDSPIIRKKIFNFLKKKGIKTPNFIHETCKIGKECKIGKASILFPNCYIGYKTKIGISNIIQANTNIEHHNIIENYCNIYPNVKTAGFVHIGDMCEIFFDTSIINKITIIKNIKIGAGSLVMKSIKKTGIYYGRPAKISR